MRLRFNTGHEVLDGFSTARRDVGPDLPDAAPLAYLDALAGVPEAALSFCAYLLPRREAVWLGCRALRTFAEPGQGEAPLAAAERWVERPDDPLRRAALSLALTGDLGLPGPWMGFAAGWAGGSMSPGPHAVPTRPHLTARAVRAGLLLTLAALPAGRRRQAGAQLVDVGRRIAGGVEVL